MDRSFMIISIISIIVVFASPVIQRKYGKNVRFIVLATVLLILSTYYITKIIMVR